MYVLGARGVEAQHPRPTFARGRLDPQDLQRLRQRSHGHHAEPDPLRLDSLALGADDLAVAVEGVEVRRRGGCVGAEPMGRTPLGGLRDLSGKLEEPPDQGPLGGLHRLFGGPAAIAASTESSPALRRMLAIRACAYCT